MAKSTKKRGLSAPDDDEDDDNRTCPYMIVPVSSEKGTKRRRPGDGDDEKKRHAFQASPFAITGKFPATGLLDRLYTVSPSSWFEMTRYNSFVLNQQKYFCEGYVYIANSDSDPQGSSDDDSDSPKARPWVARILEIRASDEHHVYARIYWMYWPEDLYNGVTYQRKKVRGRQPYHGKGELIASNHMDIINVVSVTAPAIVNQWIEENDEEVQEGLYWRQALDFSSSELSTVQETCKCRQPANPDLVLIGCSNLECNAWLHADCVVDDILTKTYQQLGKSKPHGNAKRPVLPKPEPDDPEPTQSIIEANPAGDTIKVDTDALIIKADTSAPAIKADAGDDNLKADQADPTAKPDTAESILAKEKPRDVTPAVGGKKLASRTKKRSQDDGLNKVSTKPYAGLFEATIKADATPPVIEIKDLRPNMAEGESVWTEPLKCLVCAKEID